MSHYYESRFAMDSIPSSEYPGYSSGEDWNGFACPLFEYAVAVEILHDSEPNGFTWNYVPESDTFVVAYSHQPDDDPEEFEGFTIQVGREHKKVYGIGSGSWIWEEVQAD